MTFLLAFQVAQPDYLRYENRVVNQLYFDMGRWVRFTGTVHSAAYPATDATPDDEYYVMDQYHRWIWIPAPGGLDRPKSPEEQRFY
jgi:hypothetical protein